MQQRYNYPHLQLWKEGDESLVYCRQRCALIHLNHLETMLLEHLQVAEISDVVNESFLVDSSVPEEEYMESLQRVISITDASAPLQEVERPSEDERSWSPAAGLKISLRIASLDVTIRSSHQGIIQEITEILQPLLVESPVNEQLWYIEVGSNGKWQFGDRTKLWFSGLMYEQIMPLLFDKIQRHAYICGDYQIAFHGAALNWSGFELLIPGISGAGKSTLASALCLHGATACSDEVIVLNRQWQLLAVPLPFAIKSGSWDLMHKWQGHLLPSTVWFRRDGRQLRYWRPPAAGFTLESAEREHSTIIILPRYQCDAEVLIREVSVITTIKSMVLGGYEQADPYAKDTIPSLIEWLQSVRKIEITYGDAMLAAQAIQCYLEDNHC